ncbi:MAG: hypothetical protein KBA75_03645, partial [Alphaproteobacteria bacterium]|nr:hypothetical protein [Alphaproteobacteria bacterium]
GKTTTSTGTATYDRENRTVTRDKLFTGQNGKTGTLHGTTTYAPGERPNFKKPQNALRASGEFKQSVTRAARTPHAGRRHHR